MLSNKALIAVVVLAITLSLVIAPTVNHVIASSNSKAKSAITKKLKDFANKGKHYDDICSLYGSKKQAPNDKVLFYSKDCTPPAPTNKAPTAKIIAPDTGKTGDKVVVDGRGSTDSDGTIVKHEWKGENFDNSTAPLTQFTFPNVTKTTFSLTVTDNNGSTNTVSKTVTNVVQPCPAGTHLENGQCVPDPKPANCGVASPSDSVQRIGYVGDTDPNKNGQKEQFQQMKDCGAQFIVILGDICYSSCVSKTTSMLLSVGFIKEQIIYVIGNHDDSGGVTDLMGAVSYTKNVGNIAFFALDESDKGICGSSQWTTISNNISSSTATHKVVLMHEPTHTVKSSHGENGDAKCQDQFFADHGVQQELAAHNHNYQRFDIKGIITTVGPPGYHDTGGSLYKIGSSTDGEGNSCLRCTATNAIMLVDYSKNSNSLNGVVLDSKNKVLDQFNN